MTSTTIFTVSELNQAAQRLLEGTFPSILVEGEISNLAKPTSGHFYFSLKDSKAQIRCAMFRAKTQRLDFEPRNGLLVQVQAKVSLYPDRGDYQLIIEKMNLAGDGLLKKAYEDLLKKLAEEGLFLEKWKKPIPSLPKHIGVITSKTGAAIHDILSVLKRRFPSIPITIYPTKVQGSEALPELLRALHLAHRHNVAEVLILARGGGSLEDLWPFNEELLARAIFKSQIPIVTGIGHEIDFTIADFVADRRAPTPSAAAELVAPHQNIILNQFLTLQTRFIQEITKYLQYQSQRVDWLIRHIRHPGQSIHDQSIRLTTLEVRLQTAIKQLLKERKLSLRHSMRELDTVSPLSTLNRGYSIVALKNKEQIIRSIADVKPGDELKIRCSDGTIEARVL